MGVSLGAGAVEGRQVAGARWRWPVLVSLAALVTLLGILYYPVLAHLAWQWWDDENYSHGFLIPLVSAYLVWNRRARLRARPDPSLRGLLVVAGGLALFFLGVVGGELFLQRLSLLVLLTGLVLFILGPQFLRVLAVPLLLLLFMIPPPQILFNAVAFPLQGFAARAAEGVLRILGIPVLREGNVIALASTTLEVAEACSGIRSLITLLALAATMACLTGMRAWRGLALVAAAVPIAVIANAARVAGTGILAHHYGPRVADGFFHTVSGWLLFLVASVLLAAVWGVLMATASRRPEPAAGGEGEAAPGALASCWPKLTAQTALAAALVGLSIGAMGMLSHGEAVPLRRSFDAFPPRLGPWQGGREALPPSILDLLRVSDYVNRLYVRPQGIPIWLYVGYYETQRQGQIIHSPRHCLPGGGWSIVSIERMPIAFPGRAEPATINRVLIGKEGERQLVLYWYQERGRIIASEYAAKLYLVADAVTSNRTDGALVRISAPVVGSEQATLEQMIEFARQMYPDLVDSLPS
jgi:exosortase D (VPLPA-CTERM-specific)